MYTKPHNPSEEMDYIRVVLLTDCKGKVFVYIF